MEKFEMTKQEYQDTIKEFKLLVSWPFFFYRLFSFSFLGKRLRLITRGTILIRDMWSWIDPAKKTLPQGSVFLCKKGSYMGNRKKKFHLTY